MSFTYDTDTDTGKVRLLIQDTTADGAAFSDEEIAVFLDMECDVVRLAAAMALEALAADKAKVALRQKTLNFDKDTRGISKELREQAQSFRDSENSVPAYGVAEVNSGVLSAQEITHNQAIRNST